MRFLYLIVVPQRIALDIGGVTEDIGAGLLARRDLDKAETLLEVEPLDDTANHDLWRCGWKKTCVEMLHLVLVVTVMLLLWVTVGETVWKLL